MSTDGLGDPALPSGSRASTEPSDAVSAVPASIPIADLLKQNTRLRDVADAARNLAHFCRHSLNAGPISKNPRGEAALWRALRLTLQALDNKVDGI